MWREQPRGSGDARDGGDGVGIMCLPVNIPGSSWRRTVPCTFLRCSIAGEPWNGYDRSILRLCYLTYMSVLIPSLTDLFIQLSGYHGEYVNDRWQSQPLRRLGLPVYTYA
jgi:hypothetical protein